MTVGTQTTVRAAQGDAIEARADGLDAAVRLARLRQRMFARVETARIAQYHVMRRIGLGGMGLVFAAWDPSLDRAVAIKVLRDADGGGGAELRAEAQALARLGHPNVVTVFEVGEHEGRLYLAMEYVEGQTLREWVADWHAAEQSDWAAVRDVFAQAARGLAAAHAAGVVHRDVKPENIMIDGDGRVRVMDFGLARHRAGPRPDVTASRDEPDASEDAGSTLTRVCGTPAYMAPEQFEGRLTGAAADQFALGASLYEVAYGRRIRPDGLPAAMALANEPIEVPADRGVPRALRAMLSRLLEVDPQDRFQSMDEVVAELDRQNQRGATWWSAAAIAVVMATTGIAAGWALKTPEDQRCTGAAEQLVGVWDDATAKEIEQGLRAEPTGLGASTWAWISPKLDAYRETWIAEYRETCEATQVRRELPVAEMDRRVACLHDRRRHLATAVEILRDPKPETLARTDQVIGGLPGIEACSEPDYAAGERFPAVDDAAANRRAEAIAMARARFILDETPRAQEQVQAVLEDARAANDVSAQMRALLLLGRITASLLRFEEARGLLVEAYEGARQNEMPVVAADAALTLSKLTARELGRFDEGRLWLSLVELEWPAIGDVRRTMLRALARAMIERAAGDSKAASAAAEEALTLVPRIAERRPLLAARVRRALAVVYLSMGRLDPGVALAEQSLQELLAVVGEGHPSTDSGWATIALARRHQGDIPGALHATRQQLAAVERGLGSDRRPLVPGLESLANALSSAGEVEEALEALDRADALLVDGGSVLTRARLASRRGDVLASRDAASAAEAYRRAYDWAREAVGERQRETLRYRISLATALRRSGKEDEAAPLLEGALELAESVLGSEHSDIADIHGELGIDAVQRGEYAEALDHLEQALAFWGDGDSASIARVPLHVGACAAQTGAGNPAAGLSHCEAAQALLDRTEGIEDGTSLDLHAAFADTFAALGRTEEAERHRALAQP